MRELKVGMILYRYMGEMDELHITSIKRPNKKHNYSFKIEYPIRVYAVVKHEFTWVIISKKKTKNSSGPGKHYGYGWAKNIDPCWKTDFSLDEYNEKGLPSPLSFTKEGAFANAIKSEQFWLKRAEKENDQESIDEYKKEIAKIKQQQTAFKNRKSKKKALNDPEI
jgi:hypothetical protein